MHQGATWPISWFGRLHYILEKTGLPEGRFFLLEYGNHFNLWGRHCWVPIPSPFSPSFLLIELRVSRVEMSLRGASLTPNKGHFTQILRSGQWVVAKILRWGHFFPEWIGVGSKNSLYFYHGVRVPSLDNVSGAFFYKGKKKTHICLRRYSNAVLPNQFLFLLSLITFPRLFTVQCGYMSIVKGPSTLTDLGYINFLWVYLHALPATASWKSTTRANLEDMCWRKVIAKTPPARVPEWLCGSQPAQSKQGQLLPVHIREK